jgi:transposase InsO family protein
MTWDTDIRFIVPLPPYQEPRQYLFVFLYGTPRYIVHAELLPDKSMAETAHALGNALAIALHPHIVTSDNGKSFVNKEFIAVLKAQRIKHHRTTPYSPWQHGKIECWWPTFEKAGRAGNSVMEILHEWNNFLLDYSLRKLTRPAKDS